MRLFVSALCALTFLLLAIEPPSPEAARSYNEKVALIRAEIASKHQEAAALSQREAPLEEYQALLADVRQLRAALRHEEEEWAKKGAADGDEPYALWDTGETTLNQLIMDFGSTDALYIVPQELGSMKLSLFSALPLPRESWGDAIEMVLAHNGVGVKKLNPYVKQLYILKLDPSSIEGIASSRDELFLFAPHARIFYLFSPPAEQIRSVQTFFERFSDPKQTTIQPIGAKLAIVSSRDAVQKLIGLYDAVWESDQGRIVRLIPLKKVQPTEAEKVIKALFSEGAGKGRPPFPPSGTIGQGEEVTTLLLPQGLVLIGEKESVDRAERVLHELEAQLEDPSENVVYWYTCKHSDPADIAAVLEKVYDSLTSSSMDKKGEIAFPSAPPAPPAPPGAATGGEAGGNAFQPVLPVNPPFIQPGLIEKKGEQAFGRFIVDAKSTSILMVVRREELSKIRALLKKLDVPKKMVQLDVMLVEKRFQDRRQLGINLLQLGTSSSPKRELALSFSTDPHDVDKGVLSFIFTKPKGKFPATDLTYNFLMGQENIRINANPSILAINQTPATISIVEEISINNGAIESESGQAIQQSYTRAQYGTTIVLTPTIHLPDEDEEGSAGFVSLQTNISFDTTQATFNDRPPVTRRHIENEVRIADGETVILGGLRRKSEEDSREKIPFLGDLPGIGKLFGSTRATDSNTEMFIFITPKIIQDPVGDLRKIREAECVRRPGDVPEFLTLLERAKVAEKEQLFNQSLKSVFDRFGG